MNNFIETCWNLTVLHCRMGTVLDVCSLEQQREQLIEEIHKALNTNKQVAYNNS